MEQTNDGETVAGGWYEASRVASPARPRLNYDVDVDVCVIGAGLAGLTVAREVARRGWSVAVLEANRVAWAASGRNTGFVLPGFHESIESMIERIGVDHTAQLWRLSELGLDYVRNTIEETAMPGVEPVPGWLHVSQTDNQRTIDADVERLRWIGVDVEAWPVSRVREALLNPRYFGAMYFPRAFHIHPLNYALGLAAAAEAAGARIFEGTPAVSIDPAGVRKRIGTPGGRLRASHVVLAGNVHLGALMPRLAATLLPITTYVMVTEPIPNLDQVVHYQGAVSDTDRADNHYRIVGGNRLQWSGRMRVWQADPRWIARGLRADIMRNFPALDRVEIAHLWSGTLGRAVHRMPQIGEMEPGVWVASGFGGHGLNTTAMAGELIARGIVDGDQTWRLFAPYELVWAGGRLGRALAQGIYWGSRPLERIGQGLSRYREGARGRKAERLAARNGNGHATVGHDTAAGGTPPANPLLAGSGFGKRHEPPEAPPN
ncbi:MAG TPA: FAD-binding oxidoreductase [Pseudolabrys sp.]|nr:FAD-binding oxidoreductase [Pseudolabrys sp.]